MGSPPISVICDLCRAQGQSGEDPFEAFGSLLAFDPVPRRSARSDGWDEQVQRAYIAALSLTGSKRAACRAVGRSAFGVDQLLACPGSEGFRAAHDEAMAIAADERSRRLAEGLRTVAAEQSGWRPPDPPWAQARAERDRTATPRRGRRRGYVQAEAHLHAAPHGACPEPVEGDEPTPEMDKMLTQIIHIYLLKVEAERKARIEGRIIEADFYLRQLTFLEVGFDLLSGDGFKALNDFRIDRQPLVQIAETPFSKVMGEMRRGLWADMGDPSRPEHPPARYLVDRGRYKLEPQEHIRGGPKAERERQERELEERHRQDAAAQLKWEEEARREFEERRDSMSSPSFLGEGDRPKDGGGAGGEADGRPEPPQQGPNA
ncbi:MAG TPA: hypothetical protein VGR19_04960 [Allosphingosinicella sp.]|nr:hypothetical protein [Allosphingosinicella sp.]